MVSNFVLNFGVRTSRFIIKIKKLNHGVMLVMKTILKMF
jgi:hypothetical protein